MLHSFESRSKKKSTLWVTFKEGSILWVSKKTTQIEKVHKRGSIEWVIYKEFNPLSHCWKRLWKKAHFFDSYSQNKVQFFECTSFESYSNEGSSIWIKIKKRRKAQFFRVMVKKRFNSSSHIKKRANSLRHIQRKKGFNSLRHFGKKFNFFETWKKTRKFNSLSHIQEKGSNSVSPVQKIQFLGSHWIKSNLWVKSKKVQFFESYWKKAGPILRVMWKKTFLTFFDCFFSQNFIFLSHIQSKGFDSLSRIQKKFDFFWVILRKRFNSLNHTRKEFQFFESYWKKKKSSILWVIFKKGFKSLTH